MLAPADDPRLSAAARGILALDADRAYARLVVDGAGHAEAGRRLLALGEALASPARSRGDLDGVLAALWLWHDHLDESHRLSQGIDTPTGSFWHAIMHRREGDFGNSKHWYARCPGHPAFDTLRAAAGDLIDPLPADKALLRLTSGGWNAAAFVDLVQAAHADPSDPRRPAVVALQRLEWHILFDHCVRAACGG